MVSEKYPHPKKPYGDLHTAIKCNKKTDMIPVSPQYSSPNKQRSNKPNNLNYASCPRFGGNFSAEGIGDFVHPSRGGEWV
jgi:hypothetical protein